MTMAVRVGDANDGGGIIVMSPQTTVFINGLLASVIGSAVAPHAPCPTDPKHCAAVVASGSTTVFIQGMPVTKVGDVDTCNHTRVMGSPNVFIGI